MIAWDDVVLRLGAAVLIGGAIGLNRNLHHKYVGMRTLALIAAGAASLVIATLDGNGGQHFDAMSRVIQGVLTGLGFIGAGVIVRGPTEHKVHGLTTAASVWTTAIAGVLCGSGNWRVVLALAVITGIVLIFGGAIEHKLRCLLHGDEDPPDHRHPPKGK